MTMMIGRLSRIVAALTVVVVPSVAVSSTATAHTDTDLVAVPAGEDATVTFRPQHGCGDSPTITVSVRVPVAGAEAEDVDGWSVSSTPDDQGRTVVEWTGGSLPPDQAGAFPIEFVAPDAVGELLTFPAVQTCANGEELAWISGNPADEFPAPRLLVLAPGSAPAATIDDVALDAPGREQITAVVDVDNPGATTSPPPTPAAPASTAPASTPASTGPETTGAPSTTEPPTTAAASTATGDTTLGLDTSASDAGSDDGSTSAAWIVVGVLAFIAVAVAVILAARRRR
jgi:periplasmic copper chaperone A